MKKYSISFLLVIVLSGSGTAQWVSQVSGTIDILTNVYFPSPTTGYMSSTISSVDFYKTSDGGGNWNPISGVTDIGGSMHFTSIDTGYSAGVNGVMKTVDGGATWIDNFPFPTYPDNLFFVTNNIGYAAGRNGTSDSLFVYKTIDSGNSWSVVYSVFAATEVRSMFFTDPLTGFMALYGDGVHKTTDGGITWVKKLGPGGGFDSDFAKSIHFPSPSIGYVVSEDTVYKTTDAGETWLNIAYPSSTIVYNAVYFNSIDTGFVAGGNGFSAGGIFKTVDGGNTWTLSNSNPKTFLSMHFVNSNTGYVCGTDGAIFKFSPGMGVEDQALLNGVSIFPNPNNGNFKLDIKESNTQDVFNVSVSDVLGNIIQTSKITSSQEFDLSNHSKGLYFVKVENENGVGVSKVIIE